MNKTYSAKPLYTFRRFIRSAVSLLAGSMPLTAYWIALAGFLTICSSSVRVLRPPGY